MNSLVEIMGFELKTMNFVLKSRPEKLNDVRFLS